MSKDFFLVGLIAIIAAIIYLVFFDQRSTTKKIDLKIGNQVFSLETATTIPQQTQGLMNRKTLNRDSGMIFIFGMDFVQSFWMKNTLIPLDMIFINSNGIITNIEHALPEAKDDDGNFITYKSSAPAKYVVEIYGGLSDKIDIKAGDKIDLNSLKIKH